ncbi:MAG: DUF2934 domain-containing protein [Terriglobales bacterium]
MKATSKAIPIDATRHESGTRSEIEEMIRARAYELYEEGGREDGRDLEDWLQAEAEVTKGQRMAASASA